MRFSFRLAKELGMTRSEMLERMPWSEFVAWRVYEGIEPFENSWVQSGNLLSLLRTFFGSKPIGCEDVYTFLKETTRTPEQEVKQAAKAWAYYAAHHNAILERKGGP